MQWQAYCILRLIQKIIIINAMAGLLHIKMYKTFRIINAMAGLWHVKMNTNISNK